VSRLSSLEELFAGRHVDREVIILSVRRYLRYKPSFRDLVEMMAERGLKLAYRRLRREINSSLVAPLMVTTWLAGVNEAPASVGVTV